MNPRAVDTVIDEAPPWPVMVPLRETSPSVDAAEKKSNQSRVRPKIYSLETSRHLACEVESRWLDAENIQIPRSTLTQCRLAPRKVNVKEKIKRRSTQKGDVLSVVCRAPHAHRAGLVLGCKEAKKHQ